jgi:hypothetical protein
MQGKINFCDDITAQLNAFCISNKSLPIGSVCIISNTQENLSNCVILTVLRNEKLYQSDFIAHSWVKQALNVDTFENVNLGIIDRCSCSCNNVLNVKLKFINYKSCKNWDEIAYNDNFYLPFEWINTWPIGLKVEALESMSPALLNGIYIGNNAIIALRVLDLIMV